MSLLTTLCYLHDGTSFSTQNQRSNGAYNSKSIDPNILFGCVSFLTTTSKISSWSFLKSYPANWSKLWTSRCVSRCLFVSVNCTVCLELNNSPTSFTVRLQYSQTFWPWSVFLAKNIAETKRIKSSTDSDWPQKLHFCLLRGRFPSNKNPGLNLTSLINNRYID